MKVKSVIVILVFTLAPLRAHRKNLHKRLWVRAVENKCGPSIARK